MIAGFFGSFAGRVQFFGRIKSVVCVAVLHHLAGVFGIDGLAFRLPVRAVIAAKTYALVGDDTRPTQRFNDVGFGAGYKPALVGIFNSEDKSTVEFFSQQVVVQGRSDAADVQGAGRAGGKTHSDFVHF